MEDKEVNKFSLSYDRFDENASSTLQKLWGDKDFTDVTLATEDGETIEAHKVILSSCSSFFRNILMKTKTKSTNPLLYLKGVNMKELNILLKFVYLGQCEVAKDDLEIVLSAGKDLEINGLDFDIDNILKEKHTFAKLFSKSSNSQILETEKESVSMQYKKEPESKPKKEFLERGKIQNKLSFGCDKCDFFSEALTDLSQHKVSMHAVGNKTDIDMELSLEEGDEETGGDENKKQDRRMTETTKPKNTRKRKYSCKKCDYKTSEVSIFASHKNLHRESRKHACGSCDYKAISKAHLTQHQEAKHDGVRYDCDGCDYQATLRGNLRRHKEKYHLNK